MILMTIIGLTLLIRDQFDFFMFDDISNSAVGSYHQVVERANDQSLCQ